VVDEEQVDASPRDQVERGCDRRRLAGDGELTVLERSANPGPDDGVVLDDEN
jgi:hypothetical protein